MDPKQQIVVNGRPATPPQPVKALSGRQLNVLAAVLSGLVVALAIIAWGQSYRWHVLGTSAYILFPIFGLVAFSLMWAQYLVSALRRYLKVDGQLLENYFAASSFVVLVAILLHPGLLIWQLWRDGQGLPPNSELHYVLPSLQWVVILGMINLTILLLYELRRLFAKHNWWRWFSFVVDIVMFSIFYHALRLGTQLQHGWYRTVWWFYGVTLLGAIIYIYYNRFTANRVAAQTK
jgi:hypothetical protein